jgi:hypothetical protein
MDSLGGCRYWLGNSSVIKKLGGLLLFISACAFFIYVFFPPIWENPIKYIPKYYGKMATGVMDIGIEGKKEVGNSGEGTSVVLDEIIDEVGPNFYLTSLIMRFSVAGIALVLISVSVFLYSSLKGFVLTWWKLLKTKKFPKVFNYNVESWISFWSLGISTAFLIALSIPVKKSDRYEIVVFPFLIAIIAYFLQRLKIQYAIFLVLIYSAGTLYELNTASPYFFAYSSPLLGGITTRLYTLNDSPFGVGTYATFDVVKKDREKNGETSFYTISGSKSVKAISAGAKFSRTPSCVTDYVIYFAMESKMIYSCAQKYRLVDTVKIGGFDYWYVYKKVQPAQNIGG